MARRQQEKDKEKDKERKSDRVSEGAREVERDREEMKTWRHNGISSPSLSLSCRPRAC